MDVGVSLSAKRAEMSMLDYTYDLLAEFSDDELLAVQSVAIAFIKNGIKYNDRETSGIIRPFQPQTEEQLLARVDHSLSQIEQGLYEDAEDVENEMMMGYESKLG